MTDSWIWLKLWQKVYCIHNSDLDFPAMKDKHAIRFLYGNLDMVSISLLVEGKSSLGNTKPLVMDKALIGKLKLKNFSQIFSIYEVWWMKNLLLISSNFMPSSFLVVPRIFRLKCLCNKSILKSKSSLFFLKRRMSSTSFKSTNQSGQVHI